MPDILLPKIMCSPQELLYLIVVEVKNVKFQNMSYQSLFSRVVPKLLPF